MLATFTITYVVWSMSIQSVAIVIKLTHAKGRRLAQNDLEFCFFFNILAYLRCLQNCLEGRWVLCNQRIDHDREKVELRMWIKFRQRLTGLHKIFEMFSSFSTQSRSYVTESRVLFWFDIYIYTNLAGTRLKTQIFSDNGLNWTVNK